PKRKNTKVPQPSGSTDNVADEAVHKELGDSLVRGATTASSFEEEQDNGNINKTQSKETPNESSSQRIDLGGGPRCQEAIGDTNAQTRFENVSELSNDSLLARGNTLQSDEDRMKLNELMELCTNLQTRVINLEKTKTTQANEINSLKRRVKKLERRNKSRTHKLKILYKVGLTVRVESSDNEESLGEDASKQGRRIDDIDADEDITLIKTKLVQGQEKGKRAGEELIQNRAKKLKVEDDKETTKLKQLMEIIPDKDEVAIDAIPLAIKSLWIVDWKIYKERKKSYYQIIRADEKSKMYMFFSQMLKSFDWEDLEDLYKLTYLLTPSTLTMMLEKKLQSDYYSEMAYQLLKLITKQLTKQKSVLKHPPGVDEALNDET
nr:hypothetical protein [Tanacetum cinerariifolium]